MSGSPISPARPFCGKLASKPEKSPRLRAVAVATTASYIDSWYIPYP